MDGSYSRIGDKMKILYNNLIFQSGLSVPTMTITSYSENPNYPALTAFNDTRLSRYYKSVGCTAEWLKFSFTTPVAASYLALMNHNMTSGATVVVQANSSDSWGSPAFSQTITIPTAVSGETTWAVAAFSATKTYQYWRITIADAANPDTFIKIGYVFLGTVLTMPGMDISGISIPKNSTSLAQESYAGQTYGDTRLKYRTASFNFSGVSTTDKVNLESFFYTVDIITPFILLVWENDLTIQSPIYCRLTDANFAGQNWQKEDSNGGYLWTIPMDIKEVF